MIETRPYKLINQIQNYSWGTKNESAFIPQLIGFNPLPNNPYAELWMGAHKSASSKIIVGDRELFLSDAIEKYPNQILGKSVVEKFGKTLPFLFKVLSAGEPLSIQAHPNKRQARVLHKRDPVNYPDENHKPEIAVAIDKLEALVGFRPLQEILDEINSSKALQLFFNNALNLELNSRETSIKILYEAALDNYFKKSSSFNELIDNLNKELLSKGNEISDREKLFVEMFSKYNYDVGLISIFFLNLIHLEKGEGVFLDAGIPHAYLKGNIVECMANSDNVVRAGLTPKFTDIESLKEIINFDSQELLKFHFEDNSMGRKYNAPVEEFAIEKVMLKNGNTRQIISNDKPSVILVIEGEGHIFFNENQKVIMTKGESFLLPAVLTKTNIEAITTLEFFHSTVP